MSSKRADRPRPSLRLRLALLYGVLLLAVSSIVFALVYWALGSMLSHNLDEELETEIAEWAGIYQEAGLEGLRNEFDVEVARFGSLQAYCAFRSADGTIHLTKGLEDWPTPTPSATPLAAGYRTSTLAFPDRGDEVRLVSYRSPAGDVFRFGLSLASLHGFLGRFRVLAIFGVLVLSLGGGWAGYLLSRRPLSGLQRVADGIEQMAKGDFSHPIEFGSDSREVEQLTRAFHHMQGRIRDLVRELREVSVNVAHDLRSPLMRVRAAAESALAGPSSAEGSQEALGLVLEEVDRLRSIVDTMIAIAEVDAGTRDYQAQRVDLRRVVDDAVDLLAAVAEDRQVALRAALPAAPVLVRGDLPSLQRVVANLVENALKFTPPEGRVQVRLERRDGEAHLEVSDTGLGISAEDLPRVFDRFFRGDASRNSPGSGLGLSLVAAMVRAHGGRVAARSEPGVETCFTVRLPIAGPGSAPDQPPSGSPQVPRASRKRASS